MDEVETFNSQNKQVSTIIAASADFTSWQVTGLKDNQEYFWRVKATNGQTESAWVTSRFFVNTSNQAPNLPGINNPGESSWHATYALALSTHVPEDIDLDSLTYAFEVYLDENMVDTVYEATSSTENHVLSTGLLNDNTWYFWRARAIDAHGLMSEWTQLSSVYINIKPNAIPSIAILEPSTDISSDSTILVQWDDTDPDDNARVSLFYDTNNYGEDGTLIVADLDEDSDGSFDSYTWDLSNLSDGVYYLYATIDDGKTVVSTYASAAITKTTPVGAPQIQLVEPATNISSDTTITISWIDEDSNDNALISLYYDTDSFGEDGLLIVNAILEDPDGSADSFVWDVSTITSGNYFVYAVIEDGTSTGKHYAPGMITVPEPLPSLDNDGDGVSDDQDNCILIHNLEQIDTNGDFYGNACDTDINNDLITDALDEALFNDMSRANNLDADFDSNGRVNKKDNNILIDSLGTAPGPSGLVE